MCLIKVTSRGENFFCIKIIDSISSLAKRIPDENAFGGERRKPVTIKVKCVSITYAAKNLKVVI